VLHAERAGGFRDGVPEPHAARALVAAMLSREGVRAPIVGQSLRVADRAVTVPAVGAYRGAFDPLDHGVSHEGRIHPFGRRMTHDP
jgi:hypothetical protein